MGGGGRKRGKKEKTEKRRKNYMKRKKRRKCTILQSQLPAFSIFLSLIQVLGAESGKLMNSPLTMDLWAPVLMGSSDGILQSCPEHVPGLGLISMMFLLPCPHIWSNGLGSGVTCFPGNICPTLS